MRFLDFDQLRAALESHALDRLPIAPPLREAAVAVTLAPDAAGRPTVLLIKRAEHPDDPWSGQIALPGGRRDRADADLRDTAIRETQEETGVRLAPRALLGELDDLRPVSPHLPPIVVRPFVFGLSHQPVVHPSGEVALHLWVPLEDLAGQRTEEEVQVRGLRLVMPGYRIGPHFLWGMTERIVTPFLTLARHS